jgi:photosynthetic reaction center cytochrome c subunit
LKPASKQTIVRLIGTAVICLLSGSLTLADGQAARNGQAPSGTKPPMAEDVFKNVQVLKGIPVDEFMGTMGFIAASLSLNCLDCHTNDSGSDPAKYAEDTPIKQTARRMLLMVKTINTQNFGGKPVITCYTCHRSDVAPRFTPSLAEQYGTPPDRDPNDIEFAEQPAPGAPSADQILEKYIQALGGAQRLASLASYTVKGSYAGYDTDFAKVPAEIYAKAPGQRTTVVHPAAGESIASFDGHSGWIAATNALLPLVALTGGDLDGAMLDAEFAFPAGIKQYLSRWRVGFPPIDINDHHDVLVVQGTAPAGSRVKLFFDKDSGLLLRMVRFTNTVLGLNPTQIDYADYRDVAGVKVPFRWTVTWTDGRSEFEITNFQPNVPIDAAMFGKPTLPKSGKP